MFKQIPESDISIRNFKVYKEWTTSNSTYPIIYATSGSGFFDPETAPQVEGVYTSSLYSSIESKYYSANGNVFNQYGILRNPAMWEYERPFSSEIGVISLPQIEYGEQIKKGSLTIHDLDNDATYMDDSYGALFSEFPIYYLLSYDVELQELVFEANSEEYTVTLSFLDLVSGWGVFTYGGETDVYTVFLIDFETNTLKLSEPLNLSSEDVQFQVQGNVFYDDGLLVLTNALPFSNYTLSYKSVQTIHETEVLITANKGEFNHSQNPSAVDVVIKNEYDFTTTPITNIEPDKTIHIKEILDISQKQTFHGTIGSSTGSWDDIYENESTDPTGSYISSYISTIGLYDDDNSMLAIAKLPKPVKKLPSYNINFLIRLDT